MGAGSFLKRVPFLLAVAGCVYTLVEAVLQFMGGSACTTYGCAKVDTYATYGEITVLIAGLLFFLLLGLVLYLTWKTGEQSPFLHFLSGALLVAGCACEGYLLGIQVYLNRELCMFCIGVLVLVGLTAATYSIGYGRLAIGVNGAAVFVAVCTIMGLVSGPTHVDLDKASNGKIVKGNPERTNYLIYSDDCSHCSNVIEYCSGIDNVAIVLCPERESRGILGTLKVDQVPVLLMDKGSHKEIIVGEQNIIAALSRDGSSENTGKDWSQLLNNPADSCSAWSQGCGG